MCAAIVTVGSMLGAVAPGGLDGAAADYETGYSVSGRPSPATVDLGALGGAGFRIDGAAASDQTGQSVAGVGDVNGDGLADVLVGAWIADNNMRGGQGRRTSCSARPRRTRSIWALSAAAAFGSTAPPPMTTWVGRQQARAT